MRKMGLLAAHEVHRVMIGAAAHEGKPVADPVGNPEAEHLLVEAGDALHIRRDEGDVAEFHRPYSSDLMVVAEVVPAGEELDLGALVVLEDERLRNARCGIVAKRTGHALC